MYTIAYQVTWKLNLHYPLLDLDVKTLRNELAIIEYKWHTIATQWGILQHKIKKLRDDEDPLTNAIDYWLKGNVQHVHFLVLLLPLPN